jgi:DNA-binding CsgD family transcriptional regulator
MHGLVGKALSPREAQVLAMLASGTSTREAAQLLRIAERTVATHVGAIIRKLGARNRVEAFAIAYRSKLIELPLAP